jgi:hypothetical protein
MLSGYNMKSLPFAHFCSVETTDVWVETLGIGEHGSYYLLMNIELRHGKMRQNVTY